MPLKSPDLDLNLLPILVALADQRSVTLAARALGISQPAASTALAKLRAFFGDPLFVRTPKGMEPTPRAAALIGPARTALDGLRADLLAPPVFDAATSRTRFTIALSDIGEMVFLPRLLERLGERAPLASLRSVTGSPSDTEQGLESGDIDLAVGYFPDLSKSSFLQQRLFTHYFVCLLRADHPISAHRLSLEQFLSLGHAVVRAEGRSQELFERYLEKQRIQRRAVLETPHFMSLPFILARTDLLATVPHAVGVSFSHSHANIRIVEPPLALPKFDLKQHWHQRFTHDPRHRWLRRLIAELFNDEADEWRG